MRNKKRRFAMMQQQRELDFNTAQEAMQTGATQNNQPSAQVTKVETNKVIDSQPITEIQAETAKSNEASRASKPKKTALKETKSAKTPTKTSKAIKTQPKKTELIHSQELAAPDFGKPKPAKSSKSTKKTKKA